MRAKKTIAISLFFAAVLFLSSCQQYSEEETPAGTVPPVQQRDPAPPPASMNQNQVHDVQSLPSRKAVLREQENEKAAIVDTFTEAYQKNGSPKIAIYMNKSLSDEIRQWQTDYRKVITGEGQSVSTGDALSTDSAGQSSVNIQINSTVANNSEMSGDADKKRTMTIETQKYLEDDQRQEFSEQLMWSLEDGVMTPFLSAKVQLIDRATILRLTAADSSDDAEARQVEIEALRNHADILVELLVNESPLTAQKSGSQISVDASSSNRTTQTSKYDELMNGVVVVETSKGTGSGFFVTSEGHVVTNKHVLADDNDKVTVKTVDGAVWNGRVLERAGRHDLALIQLTGSSQTHLAIADTQEYQTGIETLAIGTPMGLEWSVSKGILSGVRTIEGIEYLQTDTPVNSGNSGGPLISLESGKVLGINTFVVKKDIAEGLNFAIASSELRKAFPTLQISGSGQITEGYNRTTPKVDHAVNTDSKEFILKATVKDIKTGRILAVTTTADWNNYIRKLRRLYLSDSDFQLAVPTQLQEVKDIGSDFAYQIMQKLIKNWDASS